MKTPFKSEDLEKEIEELKEMIMDKNPRFLDEPQKYRCYLEIEKSKLKERTHLRSEVEKMFERLKKECRVVEGDNKDYDINCQGVLNLIDKEKKNLFGEGK